MGQIASTHLMTLDSSTNGDEQLTLSSRLSELARIPAWLEQIASSYGISANTQFAIDLCLEEVLTNIILHGYAGSPNNTIVVRCRALPKSILFVVDDEAPPFNPLARQPTPLPSTLDEVRIGGNGIRFLHQFAQTLTYESTPSGNRLRIGFSASA
jgi:serine/threonine-protein kinase RsbW